MENGMGRGALSSQTGNKIKIQPARARTAVDLIWRNESLGYNAPDQFYQVFGKRMMRLDQIRNIAKGWKVWQDVAAGRNVRMDSDLYFAIALDTFEKEQNESSQ